MKPFLILLSGLLLACTSQTEQQVNATPQPEPVAQAKPAATDGGPALLPAFSTAAELKRNFSCYGGPFTNYDSWLAMLSKKPKFNAEIFSQNYPRADIERRQQTLDCRIFVYESDGILVEGVMLKPRNITSAKSKLPVVIYNRGGNAMYGKWRYDAIHTLLMPLAEQGYIAIASQYRGAVGFPTGLKRQPKLDQFGGADVNDIKNLLPIINGMPEADPNRIAMKGFSRGGMMTYLAARDMPQLKALIVEAGVADSEAQVKFRPGMEENIYSRFIPNYASEKSAQLKARSVLHWLDKLPPELPILLVHGDEDERVGVAQSQTLAEALSAKGHPHKLVIYPGANHSLWQNRREADAETAAWLRKYL